MGMCRYGICDALGIYAGGWSLFYDDYEAVSALRNGGRDVMHGILLFVWVYDGCTLSVDMVRRDLDR